MTHLFARTEHGYAATEQARAARDEAVARVGRNAADEWRQAVELALARTINRLATFTSDEVWEELARIAPSASTHEPRAMGAVMLAAARRGQIERTGQMRKSASATCHAREKAVWRAGRSSHV